MLLIKGANFEPNGLLEWFKLVVTFLGANQGFGSNL